ncbi:hypothetical protein RUM43_001114 [Polyplax serrata]|uniref:Uncharacterized protein n=1 Tax=Polyplax serrata TaxID=468196 RepID=A0AAN8SFR3_POLSC
MKSEKDTDIGRRIKFLQPSESSKTGKMKVIYGGRVVNKLTFTSIHGGLQPKRAEGKTK